MNEDNLTDKERADLNRDPLSGEPGSHPVATGVGAAGGAATGAAIGTAVGGPVGTAVGGIIGAIAGGLGGSAVGEAIDPTVEDAFWREEHNRQPYSEGRPFAEFHPAYRTGYEGFGRYAGSGRTFDEVEDDLRAQYEAGSPRMTWMQARAASRAAWNRLEESRRR